ncbi:MAG: FtsX-like permease family protein [Fulvivirga sp.]|uniref:ABC transporter permease n=1 Tax=Fulvivirga sp. TaxID=1931237 RepID=UPI0032EB8CF3
MLRSIFITAIRNMLRNRSFTLINLIGLAVSMSLSLFIIIMVKEQYSFDDFHDDSDQIYRINTEAIRKSGDTEPYATSPLALAQVIKENNTFVADYVSFNNRFNTEVIDGNSAQPISGLLTEPSFFEVFNFDLVKGNERLALAEPNSIVLTEQTAERLFGTADPINKLVKLSNYGEFKVTAVIRKPSNTHIEFDALGSISSLPSMGFPEMETNWLDYYSSYNYVKLKEGVDPADFENLLSKISAEQYANLDLESRDTNYRFYLQSLNEITPGPLLSNQLGRGMPQLLLIILGAFAGIIMFMACLNYTQLTIAKSLSRAREIGIRKVIGAKRWQVFSQFIGEAIVFSLTSLALSYLIFQLLKPAFMALHIPDEFAIALQEDFLVYGLFVAFAVVIGVGAGLLPALFLSAFNPATVLKTGQNLGLGTKLTFRKILMVIQLTVSLVLVVVILMLNKQAVFMNTADYGLAMDGVVNVDLRSVDFQKFKTEVERIGSVQSVGGVSHNLGTWEDRSSDYKIEKQGEVITVRDFLVDTKYLENIGVKIKYGRNFTQEDVGDSERFAIINEKALEAFQLDDPREALNQSIYVNDSVALRIIGITENFNFRPLTNSIGPLVLRLRPDQLSIASIKVSGNIEETMAEVASIWQKHDDIHPMEWNLMSNDIKNAYEEAGLNDIVKIVWYISFLAVCIAFMGLLGMVLYNVQRRLKEIGIRKIFGASPTQIVGILNRSFAKLFIISILIGAPLGYQLGSLFMQTYAYRSEMGAPIIIMAVLSIVVIGVLTISANTLKAANTNPIKWLRQE